MDIQFWEDIQKELEHGHAVCLMCVMQSHGSSPGRHGFKQFVTAEGKMKGSIGGGVMEQKLIEYAKVLLNENHTKPLLKIQVHKTNIEKNKSGMICSGEQTIAFYFLHKINLPVIELIIRTLSGTNAAWLIMDATGFRLSQNANTELDFRFDLQDNGEWLYTERLNNLPMVCIIGGGHVSLALSKCMSQLDFSVVVFDDRKNLNTMDENDFAKKIYVDSYDLIEQYMPSGDHYFVVVMTTGYRSDFVVLNKLMHRNFRYLGMLGSREKVKRLFSELITNGIHDDDLKKIHAPIGVMINSKTPAEIAISIAAEIISIKNRG